MLLRGARTPRPRWLPTLGPGARVHPRPRTASPQVRQSPAPGAGGAGKVCVGRLGRERKPSGRQVPGVSLALRLRARGDPDKWAPGPQTWVSRSPAASRPGASGRRGRGGEDEHPLRKAGVRGPQGGAPGSSRTSPGGGFSAAAARSGGSFQSDFAVGSGVGGERGFENDRARGLSRACTVVGK